jgi:lon-related putative ATP-dependent protease
MNDTMTAHRPLDSDALRKRCDPESLPFETTAELEPLDAPLGQSRAIEAGELALAMAHSGYNLFVVGPSGYGKHAFVRELLARAAESRETPSDWCYVHDFAQPEKPHALRLPAGLGQSLVRDMEKLVEDLRAAIPAAFEGAEYRNRLQAIEEEFKERPERVFREVQQAAARVQIGLLQLPSGFAFAPLKNGSVIPPDEFEKIPEEERARTQEHMQQLQTRLQHELRQLPQWAREAREKVRDLDREVTRFAVAQAIEELERRYSEFAAVLDYLRSVHGDVIEHAGAFKQDDEQGAHWLAEAENGHRFNRYRVNLLVDNQKLHGAPVVYEDRPSSDRVLGRIEHRAQLGNLVSDFTLIKSGALHRANGGYLIVDARQLLSYPNSWDSLKRALFSREIRIESLGQLLGLSSTASLEPEPIPLDVKVAVVGDRMLYYLLAEHDPEVRELFKVVADFEEDVERSPDTQLLMARQVCGIVQREALRPLDRSAVARVVEHSARSAGNSRKLSTRVRELADLLREADQSAARRGAAVTTGADVQAALEAETKRWNRLKTRVHEAILRGTLLIDTSGENVGQINGLSVVDFGGGRFAAPTRITATARVGDGRLIDIEREVELGGPLHSKGVLILSGYLAARYTRDFPLSLSGALVFEQSYSGVEGDSASLAELCALISTLAKTPISQALAVTGSINQQGKVQPIGAINEKIEGFFDICSARGLNGKHGVVIPLANVENLMLRGDVVEACRRGLFSVYAVETVDEAIEILTGCSAGQADDQGEFPDGTVNERVLRQLLEFALVADNFAKFVKMEPAQAASANG